MEFRKPGYKNRLNEQTLNWLKGSPRHNQIDDECCPDFSCCVPELLAPMEVRQIFYNAELKGDNKTIDRMLGEFLDRMIRHKLPNKKVYIAGLDAQRNGYEDNKK
jgi:hypothetical protein